jgi:hypothetical protein
LRYHSLTLFAFSTSKEAVEAMVAVAEIEEPSEKGAGDLLAVLSTWVEFTAQKKIGKLFWETGTLHPTDLGLFH